MEPPRPASPASPPLQEAQRTKDGSGNSAEADYIEQAFHGVRSSRSVGSDASVGPGLVAPHDGIIEERQKAAYCELGTFSDQAVVPAGGGRKRAPSQKEAPPVRDGASQRDWVTTWSLGATTLHRGQRTTGALSASSLESVRERTVGGSTGRPCPSVSPKFSA